MDLYDNDLITRRWGGTLPENCSARYGSAYFDTMLRIKTFLDRHGTPAESRFFVQNAVHGVSDGAVLLYLEQLFTCRSLAAYGALPNPLPDAYDRSPVLRYMVANIRCETPLTRDVIAVLQNIIESADPVEHEHCFIGNYDAPPLDDLYAGNQSNIVSAARAAGFSTYLVELLEDIRHEASSFSMPDEFYYVLNEMQNGARAPCREHARYICASMEK